MPLTAGVSAVTKRPLPLLGDGRRSRLGQWTCPGSVGWGAGSAVVKGVGVGGVAGVEWVSALGASLMGACRVRFRDDVLIGGVYWWEAEVSSRTLCQYALEYDMPTPRSQATSIGLISNVAHHPKRATAFSSQPTPPL